MSQDFLRSEWLSTLDNMALIPSVADAVEDITMASLRWRSRGGCSCSARLSTVIVANDRESLFYDYFMCRANIHSAQYLQIRSMLMQHYQCQHSQTANPLIIPLSDECPRHRLRALCDLGATIYIVYLTLCAILSSTIYR